MVQSPCSGFYRQRLRCYTLPPTSLRARVAARPPPLGLRAGLGRVEAGSGRLERRSPGLQAPRGRPERAMTERGDPLCKAGQVWLSILHKESDAVHKHREVVLHKPRAPYFASLRPQSAERAPSRPYARRSSALPRAPGAGQAAGRCQLVLRRVPSALLNCVALPQRGTRTPRLPSQLLPNTAPLERGICPTPREFRRCFVMRCCVTSPVLRRNARSGHVPRRDLRALPLAQRPRARPRGTSKTA